MSIDFRNVDCMELMAEFEDNHFDLAIVDPPYGIGIAKNPVRQQHEKKEWDNAIPKREYFDELKRVSKHQIIWGGNYFLDHLGNTQGFFIWDKVQPFEFSLAMCEFAWTSFQKPAKIFTRSVLAERGKIHPTQKPIHLYTWLLSNYAKEGDKILDTHVGSASSLIACHQLGFDVTGSEMDEDYYKNAQQRILEETSQLSLF